MGNILDITRLNWFNPQQIPNRQFICGYCNVFVSSDKGFPLYAAGNARHGGLYICPSCNYPSIILYAGAQYPAQKMGNEVRNLPEDIKIVYNEARACTSSGSYTAAALLCRKLLMNIAVSHNAQEGLSFMEYIEFLSKAGYVPPNGKHWVDHIRKKGNEATHKITVMTEADAKDLLIFIEMLLKFIYEFPNMVPAPNP